MLFRSLLFLEGLYQKMGYEGSNIIFYFMPYLYEYGKLLTQNEKNYISQTIIENDLHIAFNVNEIEHINDLIESFKTSLKQLDKKNHNSNYEIQFIFNLNDKDIRSIYRDILKMQNTHINYTIGLDISCMVDDPAQFKSLEAQIKRLKFDYLYIDNAQLTSPYLMDSNEGLLLKNVLQLKHLSVNLNQ